jgi:hypothetical protein
VLEMLSDGENLMKLMVKWCKWSGDLESKLDKLKKKR